MPYWTAMMFVILVSGLDSWVCFQSDPDALRSLEMNPIGQQLLEQGGAELLVTAKLVGTATVAVLVQEMKARGYRYLGVVLGSLVAIQLVVVGSILIYYFTF